jgi:very-short-patch-repair endonuclease
MWQKQFSKAIPAARKLRRTQTDAEKLLWSKIRNNQTGYKFRRQFPIDHYVADFFCFEENLIIELDGGQHTEEKDRERTRFLEDKGYRILRFWNNDVLGNTDGVLRVILEALTPSLSQRERELE